MKNMPRVEAKLVLLFQAAVLLLFTSSVRAGIAAWSKELSCYNCSGTTYCRSLHRARIKSEIQCYKYNKVLAWAVLENGRTLDKLFKTCQFNLPEVEQEQKYWIQDNRNACNLSLIVSSGNIYDVNKSFRIESSSCYTSFRPYICENIRTSRLPGTSSQSVFRKLPFISGHSHEYYVSKERHNFPDCRNMCHSFLRSKGSNLWPSPYLQIPVAAKAALDKTLSYWLTWYISGSNNCGMLFAQGIQHSGQNFTKDCQSEKPCICEMPSNTSDVSGNTNQSVDPENDNTTTHSKNNPLSTTFSGNDPSPSLTISGASITNATSLSTQTSQLTTHTHSHQGTHSTPTSHQMTPSAIIYPTLSSFHISQSTIAQTVNKNQFALGTRSMGTASHLLQSSSQQLAYAYTDKGTFATSITDKTPNLPDKSTKFTGTSSPTAHAMHGPGTVSGYHQTTASPGINYIATTSLLMTQIVAGHTTGPAGHTTGPVSTPTVHNTNTASYGPHSTTSSQLNINTTSASQGSFLQTPSTSLEGYFLFNQRMNHSSCACACQNCFMQVIPYDKVANIYTEIRQRLDHNDSVWHGGNSPTNNCSTRVIFPHGARSKDWDCSNHSFCLCEGSNVNQACTSAGEIGTCKNKAKSDFSHKGTFLETSLKSRVGYFLFNQKMNHSSCTCMCRNCSMQVVPLGKIHQVLSEMQRRLGHNDSFWYGENPHTNSCFTRIVFPNRGRLNDWSCSNHSFCLCYGSNVNHICSSPDETDTCKNRTLVNDLNHSEWTDIGNKRFRLTDKEYTFSEARQSCHTLYRGQLSAAKKLKISELILGLALAPKISIMLWVNRTGQSCGMNQLANSSCALYVQRGNQKEFLPQNSLDLHYGLCENLFDTTTQSFESTTSDSVSNVTSGSTSGPAMTTTGIENGKPPTLATTTTGWIQDKQRQYFVNRNQSSFHDASATCSDQLNASLVFFTNALQYLDLADTLRLTAGYFWVGVVLNTSSPECLQLEIENDNSAILKRSDCQQQFQSICSGNVNITDVLSDPVFVRMIADMTVDKTKTQRSRRKLVSVFEERKTATTVGSIGVIVVITVFTIIALMDLSKFKCTKCRNHGNKVTRLRMIHVKDPAMRDRIASDSSC